MTHERRWALAEHIAGELRAHYGAQLLALGVYGSLARGEDGPYSDIEMHCVLQGEGIETCFEWSTGPWKAEVDVYSADVLLAEASFVDGDWPITHGAYAFVKPLCDPQRFFETLRQAVLSQPEIVYHRRMEEVIVGDQYELVGKIRNACAAQAHDLLAVYAVKLAVSAACLLGLRQRRLYTSMGRVFSEALALPDPPQGFQPLLRMATSGDLRHPERILETTDRYWTGVETWARRNGLLIQTTLQALLSSGESEG
jgi:kanamycin nucleotidyltransferase